MPGNPLEAKTSFAGSEGSGVGSGVVSGVGTETSLKSDPDPESDPKQIIPDPQPWFSDLDLLENTNIWNRKAKNYGFHPEHWEKKVLSVDPIYQP